jgi:hypothetical protein
MAYAGGQPLMVPLLLVTRPQAALAKMYFVPRDFEGLGPTSGPCLRSQA